VTGRVQRRRARCRDCLSAGGRWWLLAAGRAGRCSDGVRRLAACRGWRCSDAALTPRCCDCGPSVRGSRWVVTMWTSRAWRTSLAAASCAARGRRRASGSTRSGVLSGERVCWTRGTRSARACCRADSRCSGSGTPSPAGRPRSAPSEWSPVRRHAGAPLFALGCSPGGVVCLAPHGEPPYTAAPRGALTAAHPVRPCCTAAPRPAHLCGSESRGPAARGAGGQPARQPTVATATA